MLPKTHIIIGFFSSLLIFLLFPQMGLFSFVIIFLSSVLIDVDHYLYFVYKKKDWNLKHAYNWFIQQRKKWNKISITERNKYERIIMFFHGIEFWIILLLLIFINKIFLFILIGIAIHMILDFIDIYRTNQQFYPKISTIYTSIKNKKRAELQ